MHGSDRPHSLAIDSSFFQQQQAKLLERQQFLQADINGADQLDDDLYNVLSDSHQNNNHIETSDSSQRTSEMVSSEQGERGQSNNNILNAYVNGNGVHLNAQSRDYSNDDYYN